MGKIFNLPNFVIYSCGTEAPTFMTRYAESSTPGEPLVLHEATLELPDGRDFVPVVNRRRPQGSSRFLPFISAQAARTARLPPAASRGWLPSRVRSGASGACAGVLPGPIPRRTP